MIHKTYFIKKFDKIIQIGKKSTGGRNFFGRVCILHRGTLNKRIYRFIDFFRRINMWGSILYRQYDTNRTAYIHAILYRNGLIAYIIAADFRNIEEDIFIYSGAKLPIKLLPISSATILKNISLFSIVSMIEIKPFLGSKLCRAAGTKCLFIGKKQDKAILKLSSKWQLHVSLNSMAMLGQVSNSLHKFNIIGKAGKNRALGIRPTVRGVAKNPCDHPHGGGNGKKSHPPIPVTAWGRWAKGTPTTKTQFAILRRRLYKKL